MKFLHLADLHIGKVLNNYSMIEDQRFALNEIVKLVDEEEIKYVVIAGDIYQNLIPSVEAIKVFEDFVNKCRVRQIKLIIISGNHDSSERLASFSEIMSNSDIFISKPFTGNVEKISFEDEFGKINFFLFPYVKPILVKKYFQDEEISSFSDAIRVVLDSVEIDENERNIMVSHQFILNAETSDSEEIYAGEAEAVADIFYDKFDYTALGHIHKKQSFLGGKIRYPGALLKYSSSEAGYNKSITIVEIKEKGNLQIFEKKINYLRDMRILRGYLKDIIEKSKDDINTNDYIHIELEDEDEIFDALSKLKRVYPNIMSFKYINRNFQNNEELNEHIVRKDKTPIELFSDFYKSRMGIDLSEDKRTLMNEAINNVWGENEN